jgi:hypothetical protein
MGMLVVALLFYGVAAQAALVYDNSENQLDYILSFTNGQEIGDQIFLENNQTYPYLTNFSLEYYSTNATFTGNVQADVRFRYNNGPEFNEYSSPGNVFYDTGWFPIQPPKSYYSNTNSAVLNFYLADLLGGTVPLDPTKPLPSTFTVTVTFQGLADGDNLDYAGLNDFDPPDVGTNYGDYWFNDEGSWELLTNVVPVAFAMQFNSSATPPPSQILYDNTENQLDYVLTLTNSQQVGDQISLANYMTSPYLLGFSLEYYSTNTSFASNVTADVQFLLNDGPPYSGYNTPSNVFYDTGWFSITNPSSLYANTNSAVLTFSSADLRGGLVPLDPSMMMPSNFTVAVTFQGMSDSDLIDTLGLNDFNPPVIGSNYGDYWYNSGSGWELLTNEVSVGFAMQFVGTAAPGAPILYVNSGINRATVWWSPYITGWTLQTNNDLTTGNWGDYQGSVVNDSATISSPPGSVFFRLTRE